MKTSTHIIPNVSHINFTVKFTLNLPLTHEVVVYARIVFFCIMQGGGLVNMGLRKFFTSIILRSLNQTSGYVCQQTSTLFYRRGDPGKHGALKVVLHYYFEVT